MSECACMHFSKGRVKQGKIRTSDSLSHERGCAAAESVLPSPGLSRGALRCFHFRLGRVVVFALPVHHARDRRLCVYFRRSISDKILYIEA